MSGAPDWSAVPSAEIGNLLWTESCGVRAWAQMCWTEEALRLRLRGGAPGLFYIGGSDTMPAPLDRAAEQQAIRALAAGSEEAASLLIEHNLRLVAHVAKKYYAQPGDQEDLISIGTIGLMKAVDTFDTTRKARFATYASRCIENAILTRANAGWRIGTISTAIGVILVLFRVYREGGPVDLILQ